MLKNKIDFALIFTARNANPNGDPLNGNRPRQDYEGHGEVSDVCLKRKIRNRLQDAGFDIFVQSDDRSDDGYGSLSERAAGAEELKAAGKDRAAYAKAACAKWADVRAFGQVFAFKSKDAKGVSVGVRGPVSIHTAVSLEPVSITSMQITKSVNSEPGDRKSSDTMGMKHTIDYGVYVTYGSINTQLAEKTGFSDDDAEAIKQALISLFENDSSSARPDGSMEVYKVIWWKHNCSGGQYSSAKVHRTLKIVKKVENPSAVYDYDISVEPLPDLEVEIYDGI